MFELEISPRKSLRLWSVRLAAIASIMAGLITASPSLALGLIAFIPSGVGRYVVAFLVALVVFGVPLIARIIKFPGEVDDE